MRLWGAPWRVLVSSHHCQAHMYLGKSSCHEQAGGDIWKGIITRDASVGPFLVLRRAGRTRCEEKEKGRYSRKE